MLLCGTTVNRCVGWAGGKPGGGASITGAANGLRKGKAMGRISGNKSKIDIIKACKPKELRVVQPRRARCVQELSKRLSANMSSCNTVSSCKDR